MTPKLDVVMVAYRSEADLPDLLSGLKSMTFSPYKLHFYDNIGNTKTLTIAWNDLAAEGSAEYVAFLNTDIRLSPEWDARLIEALEYHADAGAVLPKPISRNWPTLVDPSALSYKDPVSASAPPQDAMRRLAELYETSENDYSFGGSCNASFYVVLVKRSTLAALKGFDERFRFYGQDHDFQRRLFGRFGKHTFIVDSAPVWHRCGGSVSKAAQHGDRFNFGAEIRHCDMLAEALKKGSQVEWDLLQEADRASVRRNPLYTRMPRH